MRSEQANKLIHANGIEAAAHEIGVSKRTLWRWLRLTYTTRSKREGREVHRPRVVVNESKTAKCGAMILRAVYDAEGRQIWKAHRPKTYTPQQLEEFAEIERKIIESAEYLARE